MRPLTIVGPTASGKSALALGVARAAPGYELVSADSMQVYRGMDVGTAKPSTAEQAEVPHHLVDVVDPSEEWSVSLFQDRFRDAATEVRSRAGEVILVGGTGLYVRAVVDDLDIPGQWPQVRTELETEPDTETLHARLADLDPMAAGRMEPNNRRRVLRALEVTVGSGRPFSSFGPGLEEYGDTGWVMVGLQLDRHELDRRIEARYQTQLAAGFLDEVSRLIESPDGWSATAAQALGYKELAGHVRGECSLDEALDLALVRTRRFARRQQRWFRRDPRITWLDTTRPESDLVARVLELVEEAG
ncbi:MAG: tRNA (adenosine(37)-N6)-dimethylallyltransferase MiaA [Actinomycetia bacterium]|nr:tRNA (adenosine(37)-N6)-dimethylallyltransferase MiaA [Actinomycetes bacterium]